ncbi:MAG TPA: alanine--tRNA ligase [Thermoanaerobaculia bacterium]|nr:alanine--tRNA ligase [Thermoanaerobaculia bacterium]
MLSTSDIRERFLEFFEQNGHRRVTSSSLVPAGDPTLLFTNAGMNQFKDTFLGREPRDYNRATTSQKCVRAGGKHNDLENVGRTARHHTFFEMLGNFSFGDYFKEEAIRLAWDLMVNVYGLDRERLWFSVFEGDDKVPADDEAAQLWVKVGARPERVLRFGKKDNFWQMGDTGPCGPCSEIHYFRGDDLSKNVPELVNGPGDDTMEIWNLVFMQYERDENGTLTPLPAPSVDTGAGLERLASVLQKAHTNYDIDLFAPIKQKIEEISGHSYKADMEDDLDTAVRVLCDHSRASTFLISDGVIPSNEGRGYVLRRIIRRAIRFGRKLPTPVLLTHLVDSVIAGMGDAYPELRDRREAIVKTLEAEEERFGRTLTTGMERVGQLLDETRKRGETTLGGAEVFRLYDTYGIPIDLIGEMAEDEGVTLDRDGFEVMMSDARAKAKASSKFQMSAGADVFAAIGEKTGPVEFVGYEQYTGIGSHVKAIVIDGQERDALHHQSEGDVILSPTPFYAESGGQIGDTGTLEWDGGRATVLDTQKPFGDVIVSRVRVDEGTLSLNAKVTASVLAPKRLDTTANHTATHLLHKALKDILGPTVQQAGSLVAPDRLRFDYTYHQPLTDEQIARIETEVNERIRANYEVTKTVMPIEEAKRTGAVAMFGEKYGEHVRIVTAGDYSREFCGGCHVNRTGDIGVFKIIADRSLAAGVRRMEALTGRGAVEYFRKLDDTTHTLSSQVNVPIDELPAYVRSLQDKQKSLEKELKQLKLRIASGSGATLDARGVPSGGTGKISEVADSGIVDVSGVSLLTRRVDDISGGDLRNLADTFRSKLKSGVVVLGSSAEGKVTLLTAVTKDLLDRVQANTLIAKLAPIVGGKGGGKPDLAQAGGKDADKLNEALDRAQGALQELLGA